MASIYKRNNTYTANVSIIIDGVRHRKTKSGFKTKIEAQRWSVEQENNKFEGKLKLDTNIGIADFYINWYKAFKEQGIEYNTRKWYEWTYRILLNDMHNKRIDKITPIQFQNFLNEYAKTHAKETVSKFRNHVRQMVSYAVREDILNKDFTLGTKILKTEQKSKIKYLELSDLENLIKVLDLSIISDQMIYLAIFTGARYAEIAGLEKADLKDDLLNISKSYNQKNNTFKSTKTESSERVIKVNNEIQELIKNKDDGLLFTYNGHPLTSSGVNKRLSRLLDKINAQQITFHGLRHTHASYLLSQGVSINYVSERLGHKDTTITLEVYAHLLDTQRKQEEHKTLEYLDKLVS